MMKIHILFYYVSIFFVTSCCIDSIQDCGGCTPPIVYESAKAVSWVTDVDQPGELTYLDQFNPSNTIRLNRTGTSYDTCVGEPGCCTVFNGKISYLSGQRSGQSIVFMVETIRDVVNFSYIQNNDTAFLCRLYADTLVTVPRPNWSSAIFDTVYNSKSTLLLKLNDPTDTSVVLGLTTLDWIKGIGPSRIRWNDGSEYILQ